MTRRVWSHALAVLALGCLQASVALAEDKLDAIVLGCAGMVHVTRTLRTALDVPVIDPVEAAVGAIRWLA